MKSWQLDCLTESTDLRAAIAAKEFSTAKKIVYSITFGRDAEEHLVLRVRHRLSGFRRNDDIGNT